MERRAIDGDLTHTAPLPLATMKLNTLSSINACSRDRTAGTECSTYRTPSPTICARRFAELRSRLEEISLIKPSRDAAFAEIDGAVADVDRVIRIFDALLRLAESTTGAPLRIRGRGRRGSRRDAVEFYAPAAELRKIDLCLLRRSVRVAGDPVLLAQALSNLIDIP